jgi:tetratricopeptide (TPR) repeat protein/transcriptional regulator with XRE-family HTH domain
LARLVIVVNMDDEGAAFGRWIRQRRVALALSQEDLAGRAQISVRTIQMLEAGRLARPRPATRRQLVEVLGPDETPGDSAPAAELPRQLPPRVHGFAGRRRELACLDDTLSGATDQPSVPIVLVCGTAGVGKTSLAVHWAHGVADRFAGGQLHVDLRGFDPAGTPMAPAAAVRMFLLALGMPADRIPPGLDEQTSLYRTLLSSRRVLVLLDNARDADQVRPLLPGSSDSLVVITSRDPLTSLVAAYGAHPVVLDVLSSDDARELLERRVGADRLFREPAATEEIIVRCAGLPLALSVVAARAVVRPALRLTDVAAELDRGPQLDTMDGGDQVSNVRAVLSWSYRILRSDASRMFRMLALHPVPDLGMAAAASLSGLSVPAARAALNQLTRAYLVTEPVPGRFSCHDLLRAYASEQVLTVEPAAARAEAVRRLLDHYLISADRACRTKFPYRDALAPEPDRPGVTAADVSTEALATEWFRSWHGAILAVLGHAAEQGLDRYACRLALACAPYLQRIGAWQDQVTVMRLAIAAGRRLADLPALFLAHGFLGQAYALLERLDDARAELAGAADVAQRLGDDKRMAQVQQSLAVVAERQGRYDEALTHAERASASLSRTGDIRAWATALGSVGWYRARIGSYTEAVDDCLQALALHEGQGERNGEAATLHSLGYAYHHLGRHAEALDCYQRSVDICHELGHAFREAEVLEHIGDTHIATGRSGAARAVWTRALAILEALDHPQKEIVRSKVDGLTADE